MLPLDDFVLQCESTQISTSMIKILRNRAS